MHTETLIDALARCGSPETLLAAILARYPDWQAPIDVVAFAASLGVVELGEIAAGGAAGVLLTDPDKSKAIIQVSAALTAPRRRFAIAHALGHFLLRTHRGDRQCGSRDLGEIRRDTERRKEEMQANRFAAGLLMPKPWFAALVETLGKPTVAHIPTIASHFGVTIEAAASRYVDLAPGMCAFVFVKDGRVRLVRASRSFPAVAIGPGDAAPGEILAARPDDRVAWSPADVRDWLQLARDARPPGLTQQIFSKPNGFQLAMLAINAAAERRADEEAEKAALEGPKFGRPRTR